MALKFIAAPGNAKSAEPSASSKSPAGKSQQAFAMSLPVMQLQRAIGNRLVGQLLSQRNNKAAGGGSRVIQRALTLDNADFSNVTKIERMGGKAEGAYHVTDGSGNVVVKIDSDTASIVMAYNLAKDFGVKLPSGRYLEVASAAGAKLKEKAATLCPELHGKLNTAKSVILWEHITGDLLNYFKQKPFSDDKAGELRKSRDSFVEIGRMLVFDAAIMNTDRFKVESGAHANSGNLMFAHTKPVGLDQEFGKADPSYSIRTNLRDSEELANMLNMYLSNPDGLAKELVRKMVSEGYYVFTGQQEPIAEGIRAGIAILTRLADRGNTRLDTLVAWSKTFKPDSDLQVDDVRRYWASIIGG